VTAKLPAHLPAVPIGSRSAEAPVTRIVLLAATRTYRAGAFLDAARELGIEVTVGSERPQALESLNPAGHLVIDPRDSEVAGRRVAEFGRRHMVKAVLAADDDMALTAAHAAAELGLPHHPVSAVRAARDKRLMRGVLARAGRPGPWYRGFELDHDPADAAHRVDYPCVIKPVDLGASRGVIRANDLADFEAAFARSARIASEAGSIGLLVEEFLPGVEVALEGYVHDGRLEVLAVFDKPDPLEGPFFEETIYVTPTQLPDSDARRVSDEAQACVSALGLRSGPVHAELRVHRGTASLVEIAPRSIGGLCSRALRFEGGLSLESVLLRYALGGAPGSLPREARPAGVMMIPVPASGVLKSVQGADEALRVEGIEDLRITIPLGDQVVPLPEGARYLGFLFARGDRPDQVQTALRAAHARLEFDIQPLEATPAADTRTR
jgi:biotin carboxylase